MTILPTTVSVSGGSSNSNILSIFSNETMTTMTTKTMPTPTMTPKRLETAADKVVVLFPPTAVTTATSSSSSSSSSSLGWNVDFDHDNLPMDASTFWQSTSKTRHCIKSKNKNKWSLMRPTRIPLSSPSLTLKTTTTTTANSIANETSTMTYDNSTTAVTALPSSSLTPTKTTSFFSPRDASLAYQSGLLKSFNASTITSKYGDCHSSLRLAFRYNIICTKNNNLGKTIKEVHRKDNDDEDKDVVREEEVEEDDDDDDLFLCWIDEQGTPFHFRKIRPISTTSSLPSIDHEHNNNIVIDNGTIRENNVTSTTLSSSSSSSLHTTSINLPKDDDNDDDDSTMPVPMVNELDHIEKTYPGHAFVFCRKVHPIMTRGDNIPKIDNEVMTSDDNTIIIVKHQHGMTYFYRKRMKKRSHDGTNHNNNNNNGEWETDCYLLVGGFRPESMSDLLQRDKFRVKYEKEKYMNEGKEDDDINDDNDDDDSDDDDIDDDSLYVQLVTITQSLAGVSLASNAVAKRHSSDLTISKYERDNSDIYGDDNDGDDDDDNNYDSNSETLCCACFPGIKKGGVSQRTPAFMMASAVSHTLSQLSKYGMQTGIEIERNSNDEECMLLEVTVCLARLDPTPIDTSSKHYDTVYLGDWPCRIEPDCFPSNMTDPSTGKNILQCRFESDILAASVALPPHACERLKKSTPIWINKSTRYGPKAAPIIDRDACFHPGKEWLIKNGMNPAKCGGVEWYDAQHYLVDCDLWGPGGQVLHELSHAWHCLHIEDGYDNEEILQVYKQAMDEGLYDCVRVHDLNGKTKECKAYACNNAMEYFAELSVAFLGGDDANKEHNKWYPFNRRQLQEHDPRAFDMLCRMWGVEMADDDCRN